MQYLYKKVIWKQSSPQEIITAEIIFIQYKLASLKLTNLY